MDDHLIAVWGLVVAIIALVVAIPAAWAAVRALKYAKEQHDEELMGETVRHISIHVEGETVQGETGLSNLMTLRFTTKDPNVVLLRAQLKNDGSSFADAACIQRGPQQFTADFQLFSEIENWYWSAAKHDSIARRILTIQTQLLYGQQPAERDIPVYVAKRQRPLYKVEGNC